MQARTIVKGRLFNSRDALAKGYFVQRCATPEHFIGHRDHSTRQLGGGEAMIVAVGQRTQRGEAIGQDKAGTQQTVVLEGEAINHLKRGGVVDIAQVAAFTESAEAYRIHTLAKLDELEIAASGESPTSDGADATGNAQRPDGVAKNEGCDADSGQTGRKLQQRGAGAMVEGFVADGGKAGGKVDLGQQGIIEKAIVWDFGDAFGNSDGSQAIALAESVIAKGFDAVGQRYRGNLRAVVERVVGHLSNGVHSAVKGYRIGHHHVTRRFLVAKPRLIVILVVVRPHRCHQHGVALRVDDVVQRCPLVGVTEHIANN